MSADFQPLYKDRDFYVPAFDVKVGGAALARETLRDVLQVRYSDSVDQFDSFDITIGNWDAATLDFKYTGSRKGVEDATARKRAELFDPGQEIELSMGYLTPKGTVLRPEDQALRLMLAGYITSLAPSFPGGSAPTLKVAGQNVLRKLSRRQETHHYEGKTDSEIAEAVGRRGNLRIGNVQVRVVTDDKAKADEESSEHVLQDNQYDILFLLQRARRNGYDVLLKWKDEATRSKPFLYFGPSTGGERPSYLLEWGKSLVSFQPTLSTTRQVSRVTVRGWDPIQKAPIRVTVKRSELRVRSLADRDRLKRVEAGIGDREEIVVDRPVHTRQEARRYAIDRLTRIAWDTVTAHGSTVGIPDVRAGSFIKVEQLGRTFSGRYYVTASSHSIGAGGYTTEFDARLEEPN